MPSTTPAPVSITDRGKPAPRVAAGRWTGAPQLVQDSLPT